MNYSHVADVEALCTTYSDVLERLLSKRWVMFEDECIDGIPVLRLRPSDSDESHDCAVATCLLRELGHLEQRIKGVCLKKCNDRHATSTQDSIFCPAPGSCLASACVAVNCPTAPGSGKIRGLAESQSDT